MTGVHVGFVAADIKKEAKFSSLTSQLLFTFTTQNTRVSGFIIGFL
jgi:hypothetical protein